MTYEIILTKTISRSIKKLLKIYPNLLFDIEPVISKLRNGEFAGEVLQGFSDLIYKVRIVSSDQKKGKRGGFRLVYYVLHNCNEVFLLTIYSKARKTNISRQEIAGILDKINDR